MSSVGGTNIEIKSGRDVSQAESGLYGKKKKKPDDPERDTVHWTSPEVDDGSQETRIIKAKSPKAGATSNMPILDEDPEDPQYLKRNPRITQA